MSANCDGFKPILKWPGGKTRELNIINAHMPPRFQHYFEPFLGGGAVFWSIPAHIPAYVNDTSTDLIQLYRSIAARDRDFFDTLELLDRAWINLQALVETHDDHLLNIYTSYRRSNAVDRMVQQASAFLQQQMPIFEKMRIVPDDVWVGLLRKCLTAKLKRMRTLEQQQGHLPTPDILANIEGALKAALYTYCRHLYNHHDTLPDGQRSAIFYFIRENAYAAMFRFNRKGEFNVPYGGITYNRKDLGIKIERMRDPALRQRLASATLENLDFLDFLRQYPPQSDDFLFLDPPYDTEFSNYDRNTFAQSDQERLAHYLIHDCRARFMLVIQATDYILSLYSGHFQMTSFDKTYLYTIKSRNNRAAEHLMITNYTQ